MQRNICIAATLAICVLGSMAPAPVEAGNRLFIPCGSGVPCGMNLNGYIDVVGTEKLPWVASVSVPAGVCLQLQISQSDANIQSIIIAPNGTVFRAANKGGIQIKPTLDGWYTIQLDTPTPGGEQIFIYNVSLQPQTGCFPSVGH